jgi:hypothetical protein
LAMDCGLPRRVSRGKAEVETGELLKFVVKSRLPVGPCREQHYVTESSLGMRLAVGRVVTLDLGLEEEDSQGFGITPT